MSHVTSYAYNFFGVLPSIEYQLWLLLPSHVRYRIRERFAHDTPQIRAEVAQHKFWIEHQLADARSAIEERHSDFVFLHIGLPHAPWLSATNDESHTGYLSNLVATDDFLKEIRLSLERAGTWRDATVVVTADHNFRLPIFGRALNEKVPLMAKMPGQEKGLLIDTRLNAVDERWLIEAIANKKVQSPNEVAAFMCSLANGKSGGSTNSTESLEDSVPN